MVNMDTRLPLLVQQPDIVNALATGTRAAADQANVLRAAEGQNIFRQHGAGAMQGNQNALAAIAGFDPQIAQGIQATNLDMDATRLNMTLTQERIGEVRRQAAAAARAEKDQAAARKELEQAKYYMRGLGQAYLAGDAETWSIITSELGLSGIPMDESGLRLADATISGFEEGLSGIVPEGPNPGNDYERYAAREVAAGRQPLDEFAYRAEVAKARGPETVVNNYLGGEGAEPQIGDVYNPGEVSSTMDLIGEIYDDPNLGRITGPIQGGGGNDPEALNMAQRVMAGEKGLGTIAKINQVQSRGWLAARQMLKGGGPITDYESRKAEAAVARLTRAQGEAEFKTALKDFHDAIREGMLKLRDAGQLPPSVQIPEPLGVNPVAGSGQGRRSTGYGEAPIVDGRVQPPPSAVEILQADPSPQNRAFFDEVFGEGAAARALGQ